MNAKKIKIANGIIASFVTTCMVASVVIPFFGIGKTQKSSYSPIVQGGESTLDFKSIEDISNIATESLLSDSLNSINEDEIDTIDADQPVWIIVKIDENSLLKDYLKTDMKESLNSYVTSYEKLEEQMGYIEKQDEVFNSIKKYCLTDIKYNYTTLLNGFSVAVRYGDVAKIEKNTDVSSVIISEKYYPQETKSVTENEVNVYDTGIYKSDVDYDGTGTIVAILDTGLDYTHSAFQQMPKSDNVAYTYDGIAALVNQTSAYMLSATKEDNAFELTTDDVYISKKVPWAYDYADKDANVYPTNDHGTHVAGIIAGKDDTITGVATEAQLAIMKVFGDKDKGAETADILSALQDCILLNVDAINMSLGTSCGFARDTDKDATNEIYDGIMDAGIALLVAASNDYSAAFGSENGDTNLTSNPDSGTIGSPSTYTAAMSVASISGVKTPYFTLNGEAIYYTESSKTNGDQNKFMEDFLGSDESKVCDYAVIPGTGVSSDYIGIDVEGKIAVVKRGVTTFEEKILTAQAYGAIAIIIYNNQSGTITMSVGNKALIPSCSISMDMGALFEANPTGKLYFEQDYLAGPFMSGFSSWGVMPDLELKPDITAHGGDILSAVRGGYDRLSGTSMACPNMAGATCLVRQYVKEKYPELSNAEITNLSYQLMMSTATIALNEYGNPYSPRKQGAGIADILKTTTTEAYLWVTGSNKTKLSLGDDPNKTGVYTLTFNITNMSNKAQSYNVNPYVFTESVSSDGKTVAERAYLFNDYAYTVAAEGAVVSNNHVIVKGYDTAEITVVITLSKEDKAYLDANFENGMYVEGYICLENDDTTGVSLNIPYCGFYGDWTVAPILDVTEYEVAASKADTAVLEKDKLKADAYGTLPMGGFYMSTQHEEENIGSWGLGVYGYKLADGYEQPQSMEEYASITENEDGLFTFRAVSAGLIRGAKTITYTIKDATTGAVILSDVAQNGRKSHYSGGRTGGYIEINLAAQEYGLKNNTKYTFEMECALDWVGPQNNKKNTFSFDFYVDSEAPVVNEELTKVRIKEDSKGNKTYYLDMYVYDNHYLQCYSIATYDYINADGTYEGRKSIVENTIPIESARGVTNCVTFNITNYWNDIKRDGKKIVCEFIDYARNATKVSFELPDTVASEITFTESSHKIRVNENYDLFKIIEMNPSDAFQHLVDFKSSDESVAIVGGEGEVFGIGEGECTVTATTEKGALATITIVVSGTKKTTPSLEKIDLGKSAMEMNQGEEYTLTAKLEPWYFDSTGVEVTWKSTNPKIATVTVDPEDPYTVTIKAVASGSCSIACQSGKYITSSISLKVKDEFKVESRMLQKYYGRGDENGVVTIPDDLGILYIYSYAFFDNDYITKIIVPDGVTTIYEAAIYGCDNLKEIVLPESCETIQKFGCAWNPELETVDLGGVKTIQDLAFCQDTSLKNIDLSKVNNIGYATFYNNNKLESIDLSICGGLGELAFAYCSNLKEIKMTENTSLQGLRSFYRCTSLTSLEIPTNYVAKGTFAYCTGLEEVVFTNNVTTIDDSAFIYNTSLRSVTYLGTVNRIGESAFQSCLALETAVLPNGLEVLDELAYAGCTKLTKVIVSKDCKLNDIGRGVFGDDSKLEEFIVDSRNMYLAAVDGCLYDKAIDKLILVPQGYANTTYTAPEGLRIVGPAAFTYTSVEEVTLTGVEEISDYAFYYSTKLSMVNGFDDVKKIGAYAFAHCNGLPAIVLPTGLETIGEYAFSYIEGTTPYAITIPASVKMIGESAFRFNTQLTSVTFEAATMLEAVADYTFADCELLTEVTFTKGIKKIGSSVFVNDASLTKVTYPSSIEAFGTSNYKNCTSLSILYLPSCLTTIPAHTFDGCTAITSFTASKNITSIGSYAFANNKNLVSINLNNVTAIKSYAFYGSALANATLGNVTSLGSYAFAGCSSLQRVTANKLESIGNYAFYGDKKLNQVSFPLVKTIGAHAFDTCTTLETIELPVVEVIGDYAFTVCAVTAISLPEVKTIGTHAFETSLLAEVSLGANLVSVGQAAFAYTPYLATFKVAKENTVFFTDSMGALYKTLATGYYELVEYPSAKTKTEYSVLEKTTRIGESAFEGNTVLTTVELPQTLKQIGDKAFYGTKITTYKFHSYSAPELESTFISEDKVSYMNFNFALIDNKEVINMVIPSNGNGYNEYLYKCFFTETTVNATEVAPNDDCLNLKALLEVLGETVTPETKELCAKAVTLYGNLSKPMQALMTDAEMTKINTYKKSLGV